MTKQTKILVVEDNPKHLSDAREVLEERVKSGVIDGVDFKSTLEDAMKALDQEDYTGIMSDIFFPYHKDGEAGAYGQDLVEYALEKGKPAVFITDTNHHGNKTEPTSQWALKKNVYLADSVPKLDGKTNIDGNADRKPWYRAYGLLTAYFDAVDNDEVKISSDGIKFISEEKEDEFVYRARYPENSKYLKGFSKGYYKDEEGHYK